MKQITEAEAVAEAERHFSGNRKEIEASEYAGCLSCGSLYDVADIADWRDEWTTPVKSNRVKRWTAICPVCGHPTVIGSVSGLLQDQAYLPIVGEMLARHRRKHG